ncbi:MAG: bifunctional demethylmenaquinone methyltransferase/2-methoxy-6-polyprenyl-1,4-benzoquinol methylase UbiE [FCB group bacterium]|nr:bifunctional demethylmenaquinone methyltransferase/2-methoxy-6-polyprenyl-1,4-benzoquinol methylase UbiE [FCB group bacterium]
MKRLQAEQSKKSPNRREVWKMFNRIARWYDLLNHTLSFGRDIAWRKRVANYLPRRENLSLLDLATGTGDLLLSLYQTADTIESGVGLDMAENMLAIATKKINQNKFQNALSIVRGDALAIPFNDSSFDVVTIAFGIRNVSDVALGLREMYRILKPQGKALILEFSLPANSLVRRGYLLYFHYLLPLIGSLISGDRHAYKYLNRTVETFPYGDKFCKIMEDAGFEKVEAHPLTLGIATIYQGIRVL